MQFGFLIIAYFVELYHHIPHRIGLFTVFVFAIIYRFFYTTMKNLYYTFWSFAGVVCLYYVVRIVKLTPLSGSESAILIYLLILTFLFIECYILSSPIYYPRVNWWEYDFRYRADRKVQLQCNGTSTPNIKARLTDVRRKACCLSAFEDLPIGTKCKLFVEDNIKFEVAIMSKRQYSLGRPKIYGVRFIFDDDKDELEKYNRLESEWKENRYIKKKMKFIKSKNP